MSTSSHHIEIQPLAGAEIDAWLGLWNRSVPSDPISRERFETRIVLDPNVRREGLLAAYCDGALAGFAVLVMPTFALPREPLQATRSFVLMFGVAPEFCDRGVGTALFDRIEAIAKENGRKTVEIAPYPAGYLIPGVDLKAHASALAFLQKRGYLQRGEDSLAMDAPLSHFIVSERVVQKEQELAAQDITFRTYRRSDILDVMEFMAAVMPPDWTENYARRNLRALATGGFHEDQLLLAFDGDRIVGFCQYEGEHFGPFGIADDYQGRGIGSVLLARTLEIMRRHEAHSAWVLWTSERAAQGVYARLGFAITRRFAIMVKAIV